MLGISLEFQVLQSRLQQEVSLLTLLLKPGKRRQEHQAFLRLQLLLEERAMRLLLEARRRRYRLGLGTGHGLRGL